MKYLTVEKIAEKWRVSPYIVKQLCKLGEIPKVLRIGQAFSVPEKAVYPLRGYISASHAAEKWKVEKKIVKQFCIEGRILGAKRIGYDWYIPEGSDLLKNCPTKQKERYRSAKEIAEEWGVTKNAVTAAAKTGRIPGAEFIDGRWYIPESAENAIKISKPGYISAKEASRKWGLSICRVYSKAREGCIPGVERIGGRWYIPENVLCPVAMQETEKDV